MAIAHDIIGQVLRRAFVAKPGTYAEVYESNNGNIRQMFDQKKLLTSKKIGYCDVCAIGSALVSGIRLFNKAKFDGCGADQYDAWNFAIRFFEPVQVVLIERAFEQGDGGLQSDDDEDLEGWVKPSQPAMDAAEDFGHGLVDDDLRLCAIFQNIIDNDGTFKP